MRETTILVTALLVSITAGLLLPSVADASNEIARSEGLACTACHDKPGSKLLTDEGKYFELMSTLDGHAELKATFGRCTTCHVRKPGSLRLTKKGKRFQWMLDDMEGLRDLLMERHPEPSGTDLVPTEPSDAVDEGSVATNER